MTKRQDQQGKDPAAVALGRKGGKARLKTMTPERRTELARHAVQSRYGKAKPAADPPPPNRWYGLYDFADPNAPALVKYSRDKVELREHARTEPDRDWLIEDLDFDPRTRIPIVPKFEPDTAAQLRALQDLQDLNSGRGKGGQS